MGMRIFVRLTEQRGRKRKWEEGEKEAEDREREEVFMVKLCCCYVSEDDPQGQLVGNAESGLKQLIAVASLSHAAVSIQPVLQ